MKESPKYRYYTGMIILILGMIISLLSFATGFVGVVIYNARGNLIYVGNSKTGPGIIIALMVEGFLLDLAPSMAAALLGYCLKVTHLKDVKNSGKAKSKVNGNKNIIGIIRRYVKMKNKAKHPENEQEMSKDFLSEEEDPKFVQLFRRRIEHYVKESPKYLFLSIFLMVATNLGMAMTCFLLSKGSGSSGMKEIMKSYGIERNARIAVDWVQRKGECCGEQVYTEWFGIKWCIETRDRPPTEYNLDNFNICPREHKTVMYDVPASCCTPPRSPCIHDALDILGLGPLNIEGCKQFLMDHLNPLYTGLARFHAFLSLLKLILMILVFTVRPSRKPNNEAAMDEEIRHLVQSEHSVRSRPHSSTSISHRPYTASERTSSLGYVPSSFREFQDSDIKYSTRNPTPSSSGSQVIKAVTKSSESSLETFDNNILSNVPQNEGKKFSSDSIDLKKH